MSRTSIRRTSLGYTMTPASAWNFALDFLRMNFALDLRESLPRTCRPFQLEGAPVEIHATGRRLTGWGTFDGSAAAPPPSPVRTDTPPMRLRLIPYGATHGLSLVELPVVSASCA